MKKKRTDWKQYLTPLEGECQLGKDPWPEQCCCSCRFLITDYWHCLRMPEELKPLKGEGCGCSVIKGYICTAGEIYEGEGGTSSWPHHSLGCECFMPKKKNPELIKEATN